MWARFTFITGPWIRLVLLPSPQMPPCNVPGIHCSGTVVFWCILLCSVPLWCRGLVVSQMSTGRDAAWVAVAFWVLPEELRNVWHKQNTVILLPGTLDCLGFLYLLSWLLPLIFVLFLSSILLCATWSDVSCELWWDMVPQNGEKRCQQGSFSSCSPAELCRQKDGSFQPLLQGTGFNEHNVQCAHWVWRGDVSGVCTEEV